MNLSFTTTPPSHPGIYAYRKNETDHVRFLMLSAIDLKSTEFVEGWSWCELFDAGAIIEQLDQMVKAARKEPEPQLPQPLHVTEKEAIIVALRHHKGSLLATAKTLKIGRQTLYHRIAAYSIKPNDFKPTTTKTTAK